MARKPRLTMPQSTAGLVRYFEESEEALKLKPEHIVVISVLMIGLVLLLRFLA
ncbi:MAG: preprotein translocase subunit Sec61beta [Candidatus Aenigmatarchaeota archaeon]|nr:MAG: preprotein translocase subunit Sec61beta [Candidatus Aenigmarchaeota archaeon]